MRQFDRPQQIALDAGRTAIAFSTPARIVRQTADDIDVESVKGSAFTQVIQALLVSPKASCHAGSSDWKYSSGWKKVRSVSAFTMRKASSSAKTPSAESR